MGQFFFYSISQGDDLIDVNEIINKKIGILSDKITIASDDISSNNLRKADYDKTLIGWVSEKIVPENPKDDNDFKWRIQTNGTAYDIKPEMCNITSVGQKVRLYIPSHNYKDKYAEVIDETKYSHPDTMYINKEDDSITETYHMLDGTVENKTYKLTKKNKGLYNEEVTAITLPNGQTIKLSGFYTRK